MSNPWDADPVVQAKNPWDADPVVQSDQPKPWEADPAAGQQNYDLSQVPAAALQNALPSAGRFVNGLWQAASHPLDTLKGLGETAEGLVEKIPGASRVADAVQSQFGPETANAIHGVREESGKVSSALIDDIVSRYGGWDSIKRTMATDPVGFVNDLTMLVSGGSTGVAKLAGAGSKAAEIASTIAKVADTVNPIGATVKTARSALNLGDEALFRLASKVPYEDQLAARQAGRARDSDFLSGMGGLQPGKLADAAEQAAEANKAAARADYNANRAQWSNGQAIPFSDVDQALSDARSNYAEAKPGVVYNSAADQGLKEASDLVSTWKANPDLHTPEGFDKLKKGIRAISNNLRDPSAKRALGEVADSVSQSIRNISPKYADSMKAYESAMDAAQALKQSTGVGTRAAETTIAGRVGRLFKSDEAALTDQQLQALAQLRQIMPGIDGRIAGARLAATKTKSSYGLGEAAALLAAHSLGGPHGALAAGGAIALRHLLSNPQVIGHLQYGAGQVGSDFSHYGINQPNLIRTLQGTSLIDRLSPDSQP